VLGIVFFEAGSLKVNGEIEIDAGLWRFAKHRRALVANYIYICGQGVRMLISIVTPKDSNNKFYSHEARGALPHLRFRPSPKNLLVHIISPHFTPGKVPKSS